MARIPTKRLVTLALLGCLVACGGPKDPILKLLADIERAAEAKDAAGIEARLTPDFRGGNGLPRAEVRSMLQRYFLAYEKVALELYEVEVERAEDTARVRFRVDFSGRPLKIGGLGGLLPPEAMYRFDLGLRRTGDVWMVAEADWEELTPPGR
jgi:hypothetical protein